MEDLIHSLEQVLATMDTIPVAGIDNQNKFVGCAQRIRLVADVLTAAKRPEQGETKTEKAMEEVAENG